MRRVRAARERHHQHDQQRGDQHLVRRPRRQVGIEVGGRGRATGSMPFTRPYQAASKSDGGQRGADRQQGEAQVARAQLGRQHAPQHQPGEQAGGEGRLADLDLGLDEEVHDRDEGRRIDQPVQALPVAPEPLLPAVGRGDGERHQRQQRHEADGEVEALGDLRGDDDQVPFLVEHVDQEMGAGIERRRDADAAADMDQRHPVEQRPRRRHGQRQQQEDDGPVAGGMGRHGHRPRPQIVACTSARRARAPAGKARPASRGAARRSFCWAVTARPYAMVRSTTGQTSVISGASLRLISDCRTAADRCRSSAPRKRRTSSGSRA